jgi:predicted amino acid-binding ACT domain protein
MLADAYGDPGELQRVTVSVPDRPGVLAGITQALGAERINIEDFELRHFSPERGGVLTMLVRCGPGGARRRCSGAGLRRVRRRRPGRMKIEAASSVRAASPSGTSRSRTVRFCSAVADGER